MARDQTLALVRQGYPWSRRLRGEQSAVPFKLMGRESVLVGGPEGVRRFYDPQLKRKRAFPPPIKLVLFGPGTVHGLDDAEHHRRKAMFLEVLTPDNVARLGARAATEWDAAAKRWAGNDRVVLFDEAVRILGASVLGWAGLSLSPAETELRSQQLFRVVDGFATPGLVYLQAADARRRLDRWARGLIRAVRRGELTPPPGTALHAAAGLVDAKDRKLPPRIAAIELLNILRPTIAVAWFVAFTGKALHEHPQWRQRIAEGDSAARNAFVSEVRRLYPFVPVLTARARHRQDVLGVSVPRDGFVVLDVHGTDHDPAHWPEPDRFDPERFLRGPIEDDALVPQGGGEVTTGHRCPGESVTLTMLAVAAEALARLPHSLPAQDLDYDPARMPTRPRSGVLLSVEG